MAAGDELAKMPHRSHGSEAGASARDDAHRSSLTATDDVPFGKADPTATRVACARSAATNACADNVRRG